MWALHRLTSFCRERCLWGCGGCAGDRKPVACQPPNGSHSRAMPAPAVLSRCCRWPRAQRCGGVTHLLSSFPLWFLESGRTYSFVPEPEDEVYLPIRDYNLLKDITCVLRWKCSWSREMIQCRDGWPERTSTWWKERISSMKLSSAPHARVQTRTHPHS